MRPKEFVARVIDLFDFDLGPGTGWDDIRPSNFIAAGLCINMGLQSNLREVNSYMFQLECDECLGHTVIRATMMAKGDRLRGSICFTVQDYDTMGTLSDDVPLHEHIHEAWDVSQGLRDRPDEIASMLTMLTLKTNYKIKNKSFP